MLKMLLSGKPEIATDDPRIIAAIVAGTRQADERSQARDWNGHPPKFPLELLDGVTPDAALAITKAWSSAFRVRCEQLQEVQEARMRRGKGIVR